MAILATRGVYSVKDMLRQFKAHVWCILEASNVAIYHASATHLESLDNVQSHFLRELGISVESAFLEHNFAPLKLRRDISALGLLHKFQLGEAHPDFEKLFVKRVEQIDFRTRYSARRHTKQIHEVTGNSFYFNHSLFGVVRVYNVLSQGAVDMLTVSAFQKVLTEHARHKCRIGDLFWSNIYCRRH